jgi:hypothetical protein
MSDKNQHKRDAPIKGHLGRLQKSRTTSSSKRLSSRRALLL